MKFFPYTQIPPTNRGSRRIQHGEKDRKGSRPVAPMVFAQSPPGRVEKTTKA